MTQTQRLQRLVSNGWEVRAWLPDGSVVVGHHVVIFGGSTVRTRTIHPDGTVTRGRK